MRNGDHLCTFQRRSPTTQDGVHRWVDATLMNETYWKYENLSKNVIINNTHAHSFRETGLLNRIFMTIHVIAVLTTEVPTQKSP